MFGCAVGHSLAGSLEAVGSVACGGGGGGGQGAGGLQGAEGVPNTMPELVRLGM